MQERTKSAANSSEIVLNDWAVYCRPPSSGCLFSMAPAFISPPSMSCKSQNHWPWEQPIDLCPSLTVGTTGQQSHDQNTVSFEEYEIRWASETQTLPWKLQTQKHHLEYFVDLNITVTTTNCRCQNDRGNYGAGNKLAVTIQTGDVQAACVESVTFPAEYKCANHKAVIRMGTGIAERPKGKWAGGEENVKK